MTALALPGWRHVYSGKVRDLYEPEGEAPGASDRLLVVASDRVSAFDHVLRPGIPGKGELLTRLSAWWFARLAGVPSHVLPDPVPRAVVGRAMVVRRLAMFPIECVVRGYLSGSGWKEYRATGSVCGVPLPEGLGEGDRLPEPIYTPAWKAPQGEHDENIPFERTVELVGEPVARRLRSMSLEVFSRASAIAEARGVILADTKFEFGDDAGTITLADEVLTSDSSRYWDARLYARGGEDRLASFDKQIVRDWLAAHWDATSGEEPPALPREIVERTAARYRELIERLTGEPA